MQIEVESENLQQSEKQNEVNLSKHFKMIKEFPPLYTGGSF